MEDGERMTPPATVGESRQRLRSLGDPWIVPVRFSDDDPLPDLPAQPVEMGHVAGLRAVNTREEFDAILREAQPVNPCLAARWRELDAVAPGAEATPEGAETPTSGQDVPEWRVG